MSHLGRVRGAVVGIVVSLLSFVGSAQTNTNVPHFLLTDSFGRTIEVATNEVHPSLHPAGGLASQIPTPPRGSPQSDAVRRRILASKSDREWFPATPPALQPYLANLDEFGNTAIQQGVVWQTDPLSPWVQSGKSALSDIGLRYNLYQSLTAVSMTGVESGADTLGYYTLKMQGKWAVTELPQAGRAGWLSTEFNVQLGLSPASRTQSPQGNLGTVVSPLASVYGPNGIWISELAWQQSFADGRFVVVAGQLDQSNYLDVNTYANNCQGQFLNSAFVNSQVLPLGYNNLGLNLQYQMDGNWYLLFGTGANNQGPAQSPFEELGFDNWSYVLELGLTPGDFLGLGPGVYRLQPFVATVRGVTQAGVGLNAQQQLGTNSPVAWFGRFGVGGNEISLDGATAQIATGFVLQAPLKYAGIFPRLSNDYLGLGAVWSKPSTALQPAAHMNEYGLEAMFLLQVTPLMSVQPDFQVIWNPATNTEAARSFVFQLQLNLTW